MPEDPFSFGFGEARFDLDKPLRYVGEAATLVPFFVLDGLAEFHFPLRTLNVEREREGVLSWHS